ncbi:MAG: cyclodeaminase/cyclohydrolase family protein [Candidatus Omnitrophica bacterium]|jgi:formiminotetrahydrofolate cyclodeaminase|nr:cyclodeaminase/cyclohydrolase family protein [Candidatus Omnitrophota bacterium]
MSQYKAESLKKYFDDLAAKIPAPGGGSAAALAAASAASLISMVVNFTIGKPKYAQHENELKEILEKSEKLRGDFLNLVDLDVIAYQSKDVRNALDVPFMLARLCFEAIKLCGDLVEKSNVNLISDVAVAAILLESAFVSAYFNVDINLKLLGDKELEEKIRAELSQKEKQARKIRKETEERVGQIIGR